MSKQLLILLCGLLLAAPLRAQSNDTTPIPHEISHRMPLFYKQLKQQLTFPMAWGRSSTTDFTL